MSSEDEERVQSIKKGPLEDSFSCPLCSNLLKEATTIRVCLHTFCKDCIYAKFENEDTYSCPVCNAYLGNCPQDKLRRDNNLENLRMMLLPMNNSQEPECRRITKSFNREKKKSLSLLAPVRAETVFEARRGRPKSVDQKSGHNRKAVGAHSDHGSTLNRFSRDLNKKEVSREEEPLKVTQTITGHQKHLEPTSSSKQEKPCDQLTALRESAKITVGSKDVATVGLPVFITGNDGKRVDTRNTKSIRMKTRAREFRPGQNKSDTCSQNSRTEGEALQPLTHAFESNGPAEQGVTDLKLNGCHENSQKTPHPLWIALHGYRDRKGKSSAQQQKFYIKLQDGNVPVSLVQKYLVKKLNLRQESEVELTMCGQTLVPGVMLSSLVDTWLCNLDMPVGGTFNSENALMVLIYRSK